MGANESRTQSKFKINQNNSSSNINNLECTSSSAQMANAPDSSYKEDRVHLSHGRNENQPVVFPETQPQEQKEGKHANLLSPNHSQVQQNDKKHAVFSATQTRERNNEKLTAPFLSTQLQEHNTGTVKQPALFPPTSLHRQNDNQQPVVLSTPQPQGQTDNRHPAPFLKSQPLEQKNNEQPVQSSATKLKKPNNESQNVTFLTGQPLVQNFSSLPPKAKEINQPAKFNTNKLFNAEPSTTKPMDNQAMKKIITSGNPFLQSATNGRFAKDVFEMNINDQSVVISPNRSDNFDNLTEIKESEKGTGIESLVSSNIDSTKDLGIPLSTSHVNLPMEAAKNCESSLSVAGPKEGFFPGGLKRSTKDEAIKKTLKHVEMIAESLASSNDKHQPKYEFSRSEFNDSPKEGRHNRWMLHSCIVKMRNVCENDKEYVLSLQKEIVAHLKDMELYTSVLKSCPIINSQIYSVCENIRENLSGLKTNYEMKTINSNFALKVDLYPKSDCQNSMYSPNKNQSVSTNLYVLSNDPDGTIISVSKPVEKENFTENVENKTNSTPLNLFIALLDQLPDYLAEEKQNISLKNTRLYCRICDKPISFALLNLKEHLSGKGHSVLVAALKKPSCASTNQVAQFSQQSASSLPTMPPSTVVKADYLPNDCQEVELAVNDNLPPNYRGVLDLISDSFKKGFNFGVDVFICLMCDYFENDKSKALSHKKEHKDQLNAYWHFCKTCLIHLYGTNTHFKYHCLTAQHIDIAKLKNESSQEEMFNEKCTPDSASVTDEFDRGSVCSSKSESSNRSRTRMTTHDILLAIAKEKKNKNFKGPFGLYCQVCRKYDTESVIFSEHLDTKQHTQSHAKLNFRRKVLGFKECSTCEIYLFGDNDILREHQNLQVHKELLALASEKNNQDDLTNRHDLPHANSFDPLESNSSESNSSESHSTESNNPSPENLETNVSELLSSFNESGQHYNFMKNILKKHLEKQPTNVIYGLYCHLCHEYFLDQKQWESHLHSSIHNSRLNSPEHVERKMQHNCVECNIYLICDEKFFSLHLQSLAHKAISRIPERRRQVDELEKQVGKAESDDDYSEDEYDSSENENDSEGSHGKKEETERNPNNVDSREGKKNKKLICVPNGVFFIGFPHDIQSKDVAEYFKRFGPLKSCKIMKRLGSGNCIFKNKIDATMVLQKKKVYIKGAAVMVRPLMAKPQGKVDHQLDLDVVLVLRSRHNLETTISEILSDMNQNFILNQQKGFHIRQDLSLVIPGSKVLFFGSQVTGLASGKSDFDIYIDYDGKSFYTDLSYEKQQSIIQHLQYQLALPGSKFALKESILEARVPIVRVVHMKTNTLCDISCRSGLSVENSQLVRLYLELDPRVRWLVVAVKYWMQSNGLLDRSVFTSYATVWLVLFFLMRTANPVVCPVVILQKDCMPNTVARWDCRFLRNLKDVHRFFRTYNRQSELELLAAFFHHYATISYKSIVLCPLNGNVLPRKIFLDLTLPREFGPYVEKIQCSKLAERLKIQTPICLQDPFDLSHNVTKGVSRTDLGKFKTLCFHSYKMCQNLLAR